MNVGIVGLGEMGGGMMSRLLDAGNHQLFGYNRTRAKAEPLVARGMVWCGTPHDVAERCDVVLTMVTNSAALADVCDGPNGILDGLQPGAVFVEMSTVAPKAVRDLSARVSEIGASLLDAPVSGSILTLREGKLLIMVGGDRQAYTKVEGVLLEIGPRVRHIGEVGQAKALKIGTNLNVAVQMLAFTEGVLLAEKSGVDRRTACEVLLSSVIASPMLLYRAPFVLEAPDHAWFDCAMMQKDVNLALELAQQVGVPLPTTAATNELLTSARATGVGTEDFAVIFHVLAAMAGVERPRGSLPPYGKKAQKEIAS